MFLCVMRYSSIQNFGYTTSCLLYHSLLCFSTCFATKYLKNLTAFWRYRIRNSYVLIIWEIGREIPTHFWNGPEFLTCRQKLLHFSGKGMKRHEKPLGRHRLHLEKQGFGPHRDSRYVRHVVLRKESRVDGAGHDPTISGRRLWVSRTLHTNKLWQLRAMTHMLNHDTLSWPWSER